MPENSAFDEETAFPRSPDRVEPDAHGQAAFLLAESILHALIETEVLTVAQAIDVVRTTCEVKVDVAYEAGESRVLMEHSLALLSGIERSLSAGVDSDAAVA